jgi:hypothetical protein
VDRQQLNLYIDGLLSFAEGESQQDRLDLVEIASKSADLGDLTAEWLWLQNKGSESALELMLWLKLSYSEIGDIFGYSVREVNQQIRGLRVERLGAYPPVSKLSEQSKAQKGLSCFMVEQRLSSWVDSEWEDVSGLKEMQKHLDDCSACRERLGKYRQLQNEIIQNRRKFKPIDQEEWEALISYLEREAKKRRMKWWLALGMGVLILGAFCWWLLDRPETMPNIYEIKESQIQKTSRSS